MAKTVNEQLKEYGLTVHESEAPDREVIDFSIDDGNDNVAWVWGNGEPIAVDNKAYDYNYEVECDHAIVEYGDDDEQGRCVVCGRTCDWHYEKEVVDNYPDSITEVDVRVPHEWYEGDGGIIKRYVEEVELS